MLSAFNEAAKKKSKNVENEKQPKVDKFITNYQDKIKIPPKQELDKATAKLVVNTKLPFSFVENGAFKDFCQTLMNLQPMSRKTLTNLIQDSFKDMKKDLTQSLQKVDYVCVTADCWTSFKRFIFFLILNLYESILIYIKY